MRKNKKALTGMLVAMVLSMRAMGVVNKNVNDANVQQLGAACAVGAAWTEGETSSDFAKCSAALTLTAAAGYFVPGGQGVAAVCTF